MESETGPKPSSPPPPPAGEEYQFNRQLAAVLRRWRVVLLTLITGLVVGGGYLLLWERPYSASVLLLPMPSTPEPRQQTLLTQTLLLGSAPPNQRLVGAVARSRAMGDSLALHLLREGRISESEMTAVRTASSRFTSVEARPDGSIVLSVRDARPDRAAALVNSMPDLINQLISQLGIQAAMHRQRTIAGQIVHARSELERSEQQMLAFQLAGAAPELEQQAARTVEAAANLQQHIFEQELRVLELRRTATADNPQLQAAVSQLGALRDQLRRLTSGRFEPDQLFVPLRDSPELKAEATRILREYRKNEEVYASLTAALAQAQIDAGSNMPIVSVLDDAAIPVRPAGLGAVQVLGLAAFLGIVLGCALALLLEFLRGFTASRRDDPLFVAWRDFMAELRGLKLLPRRSQAATAASETAAATELRSPGS